MNTYERIALEQYLSYFNKDWDYEQVCEAIESGDEDDIQIWEPFENWQRSEVVELIDTLRDTLARTFVARN
mgnify:FL=1